MTKQSRRTAALRQLLLSRRAQLELDVNGRVRTSRAPRYRDIGDTLDSSDADTQSGMDFQLLQLKTEMLVSIGHALRRLEAGAYGVCAECDADISEKRLRAVPFAVRCMECEGRQEGSGRQGHDRVSRLDEDTPGDAPWRS